VSRHLDEIVIEKVKPGLWECSIDYTESVQLPWWDDQNPDPSKPKKADPKSNQSKPAGSLGNGTTVEQQDEIRNATPNVSASQVAPLPKPISQREYEIDDDLLTLQGTWSLVLDQRKGHDLDHGAVTLTVKGEACTVASGEKGTPIPTWRIKLDAAKQPKQIDFQGDGSAVPGIYKLEGTTLILCKGVSGRDRPRTFTADAEGDNELFVFRRLVPADGANQRPVKVGNIVILGNTKTEDGAIRNKLWLSPGDALDYEVLRTAKKHLAALHAKITVIENGDDSDYQDIRVTVVDN
jgi:uncharacterized protein (TIGR03067 family)